MSQILKPKKGYKSIKWLFGKEIEIPEEWEWEQILDNSSLKGRIGWQGLTTKEYRQQGEFYLVTGTDFKKGKIDWENCVYVDEDRYSQDTNIQLRNKDVLITKDGTIGKIAYIDSVPLPSTLNTGVFVVRPIDKKYIPLFFNYILYSNYFIKFLNKLKAGSTINHLYQKDFNTFHFPIPPLQEQQKIASILSNINELIIKTQKVINQTKSLKQGLIQKLLTKGIDHNKFKETRFGKLPEEWNIEKIGDFSLIVDTPHYTSPNYDDGIPIIRTSDCKTNGRIDYSKTKFTSESEYKKRRQHIDPDVGDILFTREAPCGIAVLVDKKKIAVGQRIILLKTDFKQVLNSYIVLFLNSFYGTYQTSIFAISTTVERVNISEIKKFLVPLPPLPEQEKIATILSNVDSQIQSQTLYKEKLERLKKSLIQKLLTGQVRAAV